MLYRIQCGKKHPEEILDHRPKRHVHHRALAPPCTQWVIIEGEWLWLNIVAADDVRVLKTRAYAGTNDTIIR